MVKGLSSVPRLSFLYRSKGSITVIMATAGNLSKVIHVLGSNCSSLQCIVNWWNSLSQKTVSALQSIIIIIISNSIIITKELITVTLSQSDYYSDTVQTCYQSQVGKWFQEKYMFKLSSKQSKQQCSSGGRWQGVPCPCSWHWERFIAQRWLYQQWR